MYTYPRVADLPDAVHDPGKRPGEPPGVKRPSRVVQIGDVTGGDARWGRTVRGGEGDPVLDQKAVSGKEAFRHVETELGIPPGEGHRFAVRRHHGEDLLPPALLCQLDPCVTRRCDLRQKPQAKKRERKQSDDRYLAAHFSSRADGLFQHALFLEELLGAWVQILERIRGDLPDRHGRRQRRGTLPDRRELSLIVEDRL